MLNLLGGAKRRKHNLNKLSGRQMGKSNHSLLNLCFARVCVCVDVCSKVRLKECYSTKMWATIRNDYQMNSRQRNITHNKENPHCFIKITHQYVIGTYFFRGSITVFWIWLTCEKKWNYITWSNTTNCYSLSNWVPPKFKMEQNSCYMSQLCVIQMEHSWKQRGGGSCKETFMTLTILLYTSPEDKMVNIHRACDTKEWNCQGTDMKAKPNWIQILWRVGCLTRWKFFANIITITVYILLHSPGC